MQAQGFSGVSLDEALGYEDDQIAAGSSSSGSNNAGAAGAKYLQDLFSRLIAGIKQANALPAPDDFKYYESFPEFKQKISKLSDTLLDLMGKLSDKILCPENPTILKDLDDDVDRFNVVTEAVDNALEQVDLHLDDLTGQNKHDRMPAMSASAAAVAGRTPPTSASKRSTARTPAATASRVMMKPQLKFKDKIDNSPTPFVPKLKSKPNAMVPLKLPYQLPAPESPQLSAAVQEHLRALGITAERSKPQTSFPHPYEYEINNFRYAPHHVTTTKEQLYKPLKEVPCHWVDNEDQLRALAEKLEQVSEFAVDLEHHSYRSYQGFTCLMQISTRTEDFLVDTLELRDKMQLLLPAFTNPNIVKVLHGADMDIHWLQRDFGLYVVNMFDTGQAARVMEFPSFSLAYLLKHYCDVTVNKKFQLADWRVRPLSAEMLHYAREDTHYLLYVYDRMKNELIERSLARNLPSITATSAPRKHWILPKHIKPGAKLTPNDDGVSETIELEIPHLLNVTLERSKQISLRTYEKEIVTANSYLSLLNKYNLVCTPAQMRVAQALYLWRDRIARKEDESTAYVMPNHIIINLINVMPMDSQQLLACCLPVPPLVREHAHELVMLIQKARAERSVEDILSEFGLDAPLPAAEAVASTSGEGKEGEERESKQKEGKMEMEPPMSTPVPNKTRAFTAGEDVESSPPPVIGLDAPSSSPGFASPVPTADQLFQMAGWVGPEGAPGVPLFDIRGLLEAKTPSRSATVSFAKRRPQQTPSLFNFSDDEEDAPPPEREAELSRIRASLPRGDALFKSVQPPSSPKTPAASSDSLSAMPRLRTPNTGEAMQRIMSPNASVLAALPSPRGPADVPDATLDNELPEEMEQQRQAERKSVKRKAPDEPEDDAKDARQQQEEKKEKKRRKAVEQQHKTLAGLQAASGAIPKSMREIYKSSNENRRRAKEREAAAAAAASSAPSAEEGKQGAEEEAAPQQEGQGRPEVLQKAEDFMREIGWLPKSKAGSSSSSSSSSSGNSSTSAASGKAVAPAATGAVEPFDYTAHSLPRQSPAIASQSYFNPYEDEQSQQHGKRGKKGGGSVASEPIGPVSAQRRRVGLREAEKRGRGRGR